MAVTVKSQDEINRMRDAGKILAEVHEKLEEIIKPGITTLEIDRKGEEFIRNAGCIPSFKDMRDIQPLSAYRLMMK